jgi:hypothetical protein
MYNEKELSTYLRVVTVWPSDRETLPQPLLKTLSHSERYNQAGATDPQLYVVMASHSKRRIGSTNQDVVFLLPSEKRNSATICHSQVRANLNTKQLN